MQILLNTEELDKDQINTVLSSISFVKDVRFLDSSTFETYLNLKEAAEEVKLHKKGKVEMMSAEELIDEL